MQPILESVVSVLHILFALAMLDILQAVVRETYQTPKWKAAQIETGLFNCKIIDALAYKLMKDLGKD